METYKLTITAVPISDNGNHELVFIANERISPVTRDEKKLAVGQVSTINQVAYLTRQAKTQAETLGLRLADDEH